MDLISTTTLLKWFDNEALNKYKMNLVITKGEEAIAQGANLSDFRSMVDGALNNNREALNGTRFHSYAEAVAKGKADSFDIEAETPATQAFIAQFNSWLDRYNPKFIYSELPVYNRRIGYAGTCDSIMEIDGKTYLVDFKTSSKSKRPWRSVKWQLAAYRGAEKMTPGLEPRRIQKDDKRFYQIPDSSYDSLEDMVKVDSCLVIQISPFDISTYEVDVTTEDYKYFAYITKAYHSTTNMGWASKWN
jgi:hypothetical protein